MTSRAWRASRLLGPVGAYDGMKMSVSGAYLAITVTDSHSTVSLCKSVAVILIETDNREIQSRVVGIYIYQHV